MFQLRVYFLLAFAFLLNEANAQKGDVFPYLEGDNTYR